MTKTKKLSSEISKLSNKNLYKLCKKYGYMTLEARRKFMGLLPEVYKRRLYKEKGYSSIYEFAGKLAGLSNAQVDLTLRLEKRFLDKPILRRALVEGEVSINKLLRITSIATSENERELFEKTKNLSNRAVEVFIRDVKNCSKVHVHGISGNKSISKFDKANQKSMHVHGISEDQKSVHVYKTTEEKLHLDSDVREKLLELQEKGIDINEFLREALEQREQEIAQKKKEIGEEEMRKYTEKLNKLKTEPTTSLRTSKSTNPPKQKIEKFRNSEKNNKTNQIILKKPIPSRYLNVRIKKILKQEHGTKCSIPQCSKPAKTIHHTQRFALNPIHDPRFLAPLCQEHHEIAHKIDVKFLDSGTFSRCH